MPTNPLEYMPEGLRRQIDKCLSMKKEAQLSGNSNVGVSVIFPPCGLEGVGFAVNPPLNQVPKVGLLVLSEPLTFLDLPVHVLVNFMHVHQFFTG